MAKDDKQRKKNVFTDPLNWVLLVLAVAFGYYIVAIPYWQNFYLKEAAQVMTLQEYMQNPSHPREPMLRTLGAPPPSIEVTIEGLTVKHIDTDSIMLTSNPGATNPAATSCELPPTFGPEATPNLNDILVAGDNMDLLELSEGQQVSLRVFGLSETAMGWVPMEPTLESDQEERFTKEELDALEFIKISANGNETEMPYIEVGEFRLASGLQAEGQLVALAELADDTGYITTKNSLGINLADVHGVRLVDWDREGLAPFFIVEDDAGHRAHVYYNPRSLSEWRWGLDLLSGQCVVVRGVLRTLRPAELRNLEADGNIQALIDGHAIMSTNGGVVISLLDPSGALQGSGF